VPPNHGDPTPWRGSLSNITGWVSGLLQVPGLSATVDPASLILCNQGLPPSQGGVLLTFLQEQLTSQPYIVPISNQDVNCVATVESYQDDRITLTPAGPTTLTVSGIEPDGSLDLSGSTSAVTKVDFYDEACGTTPPPTPTQTCIQFAPTTITFTTKVTPPPSTAPPGVAYPLVPQALQGELPPPSGTPPPPTTASATPVGNNFAVPAFIDTRDGVPGGCFLAAEFNGPLSGFNNDGPGETAIYPSTFGAGAQPQVAAAAGWVDFASPTQIVSLGS
jgi:hypothetical protein